MKFGYRSLGVVSFVFAIAVNSTDPALAGGLLSCCCGGFEETKPLAIQKGKTKKRIKEKSPPSLSQKGRTRENGKNSGQGKPNPSFAQSDENSAPSTLYGVVLGTSVFVSSIGGIPNTGNEGTHSDSGNEAKSSSRSSSADSSD